MVIKQFLIDFRIPANTSKTQEDVIQGIIRILKLCMNASEPTYTATANRFSKLFLFEDGDKSQCTVRIFPDGLVTMDILFDYENNEDLNQVYYSLKEAVKESDLTSATFIPPITRGKSIKNYYDTSDGRLKEYDFDEVVFRERSKLQEILIVHSKQFGNMLFLDEMEMIADSDIVYTRGILGNGRENFKDKTVLILGGGDGGIIHELLKEKPKFVTMVEIDIVVIEAAKKYLRKICGNSLDSLTGENYQIIIEDCFVELRKYIKEGRTFDYVLNDLTDIPIGGQENGEETWDFIRDVLDLSLQVLDKNGKYFAQGAFCATNQRAQEKYKDLLSESRWPIEYTKELVFVPSFLEVWTFYEVWMKDTGPA